jgi:hypothetical protein
VHTLMVIAGGFALLALCLLVGRLIGEGGRPSLAKAALAFLPLWLVAALINMWVGVSRAGYSVAAETPIMLVVFGAPAAVALLLWRRFAQP